MTHCTPAVTVPMMVSPTAFAERMRRHWEDTLDNVSSPSLEAVWRQMAHAFGQAINSHGKEDARTWRILQPPTGTGKSQGLAVYCAMLAQQARQTIPTENVGNNLYNGKEPKPHISPIGVLIVVRLIDQANEIASTINRMAGCEVARAKHSDTRLTAEEIEEIQILVITHRSYSNALIRTIDPDGIDTWPKMSTWRFGRRKLTVIDEALDIIDHSQITLDDLSFVIGAIPAAIRRQHLGPMETLNTVVDVLSKVSEITEEKVKASDDANTDKVVWRNLMEMPDRYSLKPLRVAIKGVRWDNIIHRRNDDGIRLGVSDRVDRVLKDVETTLRYWSWYHRKGGEGDTFNAARMIVPDDLHGPVVLDATASQNLLWELFEEAQIPFPTPPAARSYRNVTLHVARANGVGKSTMQKRCRTRIPRLVSDLTSRLSPENKLFICAHKNVEHHLKGYDYGAGKVSTAHWGAVDGKNEWSNFDTAVIFGLPYRDRVWATNTFFAMQGLQDNAWLSDKGNREWATYDDIRRELIVRQIAVSVIQAINRIRCRRVIDCHGNCAKADIYILLPWDTTGDRLLQAIKDEMPGIAVTDWDFRLDGDKTTKRRGPKPSFHMERVLTFMENTIPGVYSASNIQKAIGMARDTWRDVKLRLTESGSQAAQRLAEAGVTIKIENTERGYEKLSLVKA